MYQKLQNHETISIFNTSVGLAQDGVTLRTAYVGSFTSTHAHSVKKGLGSRAIRSFIVGGGWGDATLHAWSNTAWEAGGSATVYEDRQKSRDTAMVIKTLDKGIPNSE